MSKVTEIKWCDGKMVNQNDEELIVVTKEEYEGHVEANQHLKGYIYDSLVFRYQIALERGIESRTLELLGSHANYSKSEAEARARDLNTRDLMRFCKILNEVMGEHD